MNTESLLRELTRRGVRLEPRGDRLHVSAPMGVLTEELGFALSEHKQALLELLATPPRFDLPRELRAAWAGAARELGEALGYPALVFRPGHAVAPGEALWGKFIAKVSIPDLELVVHACQAQLAERPLPPTTLRLDERRP